METVNFTLKGLKHTLDMAKSNTAAATLLIGLDMTSLGLDVQKARATMQSLHSNFSGPWNETPIRLQDLEEKIPIQYYTNGSIRDKLPSIKMNMLTEDNLFYIFYNFSGEIHQVNLFYGQY